MVNLVWILGIYKNSGILVKTVRVGCVQIEIKMKKIRKELLEVSGHWVRVFRVTNMSFGLFPCVGEDDL